MYALYQRLLTRQGVLTEVPAFAFSLAIAEMFFKFHSFTLECLAFLATWLVLGVVISRVVRFVAPSLGDTAPITKQSR